MEDYAEVAEGERHASKRRRMAEKKTVVTVKIGEKVGNLKNEGLPSDLWSWRKYGQKPIKGSPYPRGYYRCSTSKGCSAKKQIERCRTDASLLIITYSSTHNHPNPNANPLTKPRNPNYSQEHPQEQNSYKHTSVPPPNGQESAENDNDHFRYCKNSVKEAMVSQVLDTRCFVAEAVTVTETETALLFENKPAPSEPTPFSAIDSETGNDFFDELEELPMSSGFSKLMRNDNVSDEWIPVVPS